MTNGLGGYACGTLAGANTRRYHAFLMASFKPPVERMLLVAKVDVSVDYRGREYPLAANEFAGGAIDPHGFIQVESFRIEDGVPVWRYAIGDALLEQRIFMAPAANTSYLRLVLLRAGTHAQVRLKPLVTYRDYHGLGRGARPFRATPEPGAGLPAADQPGPRACSIDAGAGSRPYRLAVSQGQFLPGDTWYWNFLYREEFGRGLDALEDLWGPGLFTAELTEGTPLYFTASAEPGPVPPGDEVLAARTEHARSLVEALPRSAPPWVATLAVASDQFIVQRGTGSGPASRSVIAGYPWFTDWGRDTMIALPGLTTVLRRFDLAAGILRTWAGFVDRGMLPNRFADAGEALEYNTADATLWMFHAVDAHLEARRDPKLLRELFPVLSAIIRAHVEGTRFGIGMDPADGLLRAGEPGVQLTWMDAKTDGHVFTPRSGKPVEINALWVNALAVTARLAGRLRDTAEKRFCQTLLERAVAGFDRFWNEDQGCLFDVIDVDGRPGVDASVRPNQLFAVSLPVELLSPARMRAVVDTCARELLTSHGLRSLGPGEAGYQPRYAGDVWQRDSAYHQGTVWSWLLGPFARAHYRVHGDAAAALRFLEPMAQHLAAACIGSVSEVFDGDAPYTARGCFAQAWSVAEILRAWIHLDAKTGSLSATGTRES